MTEADKGNRLNAIIEGASKLPVENQEYILAVIKGMLFTRSLLAKQDNQIVKPPEREDRRE